MNTEKTKAAGGDPVAVADRLGRPLQSLRVSLLDRCNFRCRYCMPAELFGPDHAFLDSRRWMSFSEIERVVRVFVSLGVTRIRLTGGEPLLRPGMIEAVTRIASIDGIEDIALTTNGSRLKQMAPSLVEAGLHRVTLSIDSLDQATLERMSGSHASVTRIIEGLDAALDCGLPVKLNTVLIRGINEDQIMPLVEMSRGKGVPLRFIEYMDVGNTNGWCMDQVVTEAEVRAVISRHYPLKPLPPAIAGETAVRFEYADRPGLEVGFVSSVTRPFCRGCNRARLSSDGQLFTCLFASTGTDLLSGLRSGGSDQQLRDRIRSVWGLRRDRYSEERSAPLQSEPGRIDWKKIEMSYIGG